ncbi:enoyl-CoA hydratase/carnithine racemase [Pseudochelatococcus lubricantis]|uniref:Enoyl-CoA hydratase/carnithine racemase n=1 Tax=Pseudochelatococcus lubricantis TaxID=1538102 RepID=A0ABX0V0P2_9HYPH|nr:enoyl-CoA hydratase/isomerase family protein [Pseudochelatococcus lubricantis]NIJ58774.1 enoyl-CoA hydratase/carnithine racemase [Pseudochelatococcus lubricantis]
MDDLRVETPGDGVRLLVLSRDARRNALSRKLIGALRDAVAAARVEGLRAIVIAAEGRVFSAGADFAELDGSVADIAFDEEMSALTASLRDSALISVVAINGACIGAGLDLALACDFRVASPDAIFALPAVRMGILYNPRRLAQILPRMSHAAATRLLLLAERLDCTDARIGGIVTHVADRPGADAVRERALEIAAAAVGLPSLAQEAAKAFVASCESPDFKVADWEARRLELLASDQRREALEQARTKK